MKNEFHNRRNRWSGFKGRSLITLVLVLSMIISVPFFSNAAGKFDSEEPCSLTVYANNTDMENEGYKDLESMELVIDLYQLASAVPNGGSDGYTFDWNYESLKNIYKSLNSSFAAKPENTSDDSAIVTDSTADALHDLSQAAANIVLNADEGTVNAGIECASSQKGTNTIKLTDLDAGLYLLVVRGSEANDYVTKLKNGDTVTRAWSNNYSYVFSPQLVSLPKRGENIGSTNTADKEDWNYNVTVYLKAERDNGSLRIVKTLERYLANGEPATFVFEVEATLGNNIVYKNEHAIDFNSPGSKEIVINGIPVGAVVTVTEVYTGAHYSLKSGESQNAVITPNIQDKDPTTVVFDNDYDRRHTGGHGITNKFTYNADANGGTGGWEWEQIEAGSQDSR